MSKKRKRNKRRRGKSKYNKKKNGEKNKIQKKNKKHKHSEHKKKQSSSDHGDLIEDFRARRRKQDIIFITVMILIGIGILSAYYFYWQTWGVEQNDQNDLNVGENNIIIHDNGDGDSESKIAWQHDYEEALNLAQSQNKPVLIDFYTDWCTFCIEMDERTYTDPIVIEKTTNFVCVKVDGDQRSDLINSYYITGYPTTVFLNKAQIEVHRVDGFVNAGPFIEDMDYALQNS